MPGSDISHAWCNRVTTDEVLDIWSWYPNAVFLIYVEEKGEETGKRHYHYLIINSETNTRNQEKALLTSKGFVGNEMKSVKKWDGKDRYIQYMYKSGTPVLKGTPPVGLKSPDVYKELVKAEAEMKKERKKVREDGFNALFEYCKNNYDSDIPLKSVIDLYHKFHEENNLKLKSFGAQETDIMNILWKLGNKRFKARVQTRLYERLS